MRWVKIKKSLNNVNRKIRNGFNIDNTYYKAFFKDYINKVSISR